MRSHRPPQILEITAIVLGYPSEVYGKILLLKIQYTESKDTEIKLVLHSKLHALLAFTVKEKEITT